MSETDKTYSEATAKALADAHADYFLALVARGMKRDEALQVTMAWVMALVLQQGKQR